MKRILRQFDQTKQKREKTIVTRDSLTNKKNIRRMWRLIQLKTNISKIFHDNYTKKKI